MGYRKYHIIRKQYFKSLYLLHDNLVIWQFAWNKPKSDFTYLLTHCSTGLFCANYFCTKICNDCNLNFKLKYMVIKHFETYIGGWSYLHFHLSRIPNDYSSGTLIGKKDLTLSVFRIRIHRIHMFLGLPDPDPLVRDMDPDPDLWKMM